MGAIQSSGGVRLTQVLACPTSRQSPSRGSSTPAAMDTSVSGDGSMTFSSARTKSGGTSCKKSRQNRTDCSTYHSGK